MVIVPTVNMAEELYFKLIIMNNESIRLCVNGNAFNVFHESVYDGVNVIITTYTTASKHLGDLFDEYYERVQRLDYINQIFQKLFEGIHLCFIIQICSFHLFFILFLHCLLTIKSIYLMMIQLQLIFLMILFEIINTMK